MCSSPMLERDEKRKGGKKVRYNRTWLSIFHHLYTCLLVNFALKFIFCLRPQFKYSSFNLFLLAVYENPCDYSNGKWVRTKRGPLYNGTTCVKMKKNQNCIANGRPDSGFLYWKWKPSECHLPRFDPNTFLQFISNKHVAFVGDSISRNHLESLLCMLATVTKPCPTPRFSSVAFSFSQRYLVLLLVPISCTRYPKKKPGTTL